MQENQVTVDQHKSIEESLFQHQEHIDNHTSEQEQQNYE